MNAQLPVELPAGLAEPLHYPGGGNPWLGPLLLLLALAALAALIRWFRSRRRVAGAAPRPSRPVLRPARAAIVRAIDALRERFVEEARFREGCHELAALLKAHYETAGLAGSASLPYTRMTAREIARSAGDQPATRLFELLSDLQFGRPEPSQDDFVGACDLAGQVVKR